MPDRFDLPDLGGPGRRGHALRLVVREALLTINSLNLPTFSTADLAIRLRYEHTMLTIGRSTPFSALTTEGLFVPEFGLPVAISLWWKAGSDFSGLAAAADAAPPYYKPDLINRLSLPGPLEVQKLIGSHVLAAGGQVLYHPRGTIAGSR
ncbi:MAG: hypothetical protein A2087_12400 [Spirochaetes bacterium GWD1_61_31]|nr:MAG: hypothetical protein A2Y37_06325 [Spirochaetes bacterium GWB1_60_80]OHD33597.1 MAG: hypothetical protein A2004_06490 [Spirochaetes bacterium GWC1_61_12]OHD38520.1 MAG: hypothetical protein A2087_12400 [Spirochaetes bacterium GWD1_61_31]OHD43038.1 MAG: hypothetical protein A2Y35_01285 [Spirochaetes bacterium GWE1_60_18]OHD59633.1 MAG: hypothetical protein A2Y32_12165 [Spirochaetes bacterium GWF1_60_12]